MVAVARGLTAGSVVLVVTLAALWVGVGLSAAGVLVGLLAWLVVALTMSRSNAVALGPADLVTVVRIALACAVAALVAEGLAGQQHLAPLVGLTAVALVLDAVDGQVARHTETASGFGARFDGEADAFLMLVLSVHLAVTLTPWVLAIGAARYLFAVAGWVLPWLRGRLPARYWRKVVTAVQGIVLLLATAELAPRWAAYAALLVALGLLAESFGRDVVWLWRHRRLGYDLALGPARRSAFPPGEFVGQESFMPASEIRDLAVRAGVGPGVAVLDLCCGVGGPGRFLATTLGGSYLGVDASAGAIAIARDRADGPSCRFEVGRVPPLPAGRFDVVLLLETLLAFRDKEPLLRAVSAALVPGGRFAFTVEEGAPLTPAEARRMPASDTVWPVRLPELIALLDEAGLLVTSLEPSTGSHRRVVEALLAGYAADRVAIEARLGRRAADDLLASHRLWADWLASGRVRKFACVVEKVPVSAEPGGWPTRSASWEPTAGSAAGPLSDRSER